MKLSLSSFSFSDLSRVFVVKKRGSVRLLALAAALLVSACSTIVNQSVPFNDAEYDSSSATGTAVVNGHAFIRSDTGVKRTAAGIRISLVPLTPYTEERAKIMELGKDPAPADPRLAKYVRTSVGDLDGSYKFEGLPAGSYLVFCRIQWERPFVRGRRRDGSGNLYALARVQLSNGEQKTIVVTNVSQQ